MNTLPGSDLPKKVVRLIRKHTRRPQVRQTHLPRNVHTPPGTLVVSPEELPTTITVFAYGPQGFEERTLGAVAELDKLDPAWPVLWVNVEGLGSADVLHDIAARFNLHPLAMEDVADTTQRAKVEPYGDTTFVVLPMPHTDERGFWTEQLSMFITSKFVITFQSAHAGDCLEELRARIRTPRGRVRSSAAPYLAYAIADAVIDGYFPPVNSMGDALDELEDLVLTNPSADQLLRIRRSRSDLLRLRRAVYPMRDAMVAFAALDRVFDADTRPYLRDLNDHVSRLLDQLETDRYLASDLLEIYMTSVNLKLGEVTKVLTIIATIFIPLSFIAGLYGMNFEAQPEYKWHYGYPFALGLMAATALAFIVYFWRKGWLRDSTVPRMESPGNPADREPTQGPQHSER
ncbi:MAG: magnesium/cobalt transporter CorA [Phycisphaerales bacterium]